MNHLLKDLSLYTYEETNKYGLLSKDLGRLRLLRRFSLLNPLKVASFLW